MNGDFVGALAAVGARNRMVGGRHLEIRDLLLAHAEKLGAEFGSR
jgi:hypothetical protein